MGEQVFDTLLSLEVFQIFITGIKILQLQVKESKTKIQKIAFSFY